jgi:carbon monoxide dehydrogenase subunit G
MHTVSASRVIDAPSERVWQVLDNFGNVAAYNPGVDASRLVTDVATGEGACRECVLSESGRIEETVVDYRSGEGYTVEFTDVGSLPLASNTVDVSLHPVDADRTEVTMSSRFAAKYGPLGWLLATVVMKRRFRETFDDTLAGLDEHLRSEATGATDGSGERRASS